ncbi:MAG: two-component system sensor histidine kinase/response regulator [Flavobacteriales bacterium]|jgi:two-component system sensor histidine kinase/response regulator
MNWPDGTKILLVEDNEINRELFEIDIEDYDLSCDCAENGQEALDRLSTAPANEPYTIVFMDCHMPVMDGCEATAKIRAGEAGERYKQVPIIALTSSDLPEDQEKCLSVGMSVHLTKPVAPDEVLATLKKYLLSDEPAAAPPKAAVIPGLDVPQDLEIIDLSAGLPAAIRRAEVYLRVLGTFYEHSLNHHQVIEALIKSGDVQAVREYAHGLKGGGSNLGLSKASECARGIEEGIIYNNEFDVEELWKLSGIIGLTLKDILRLKRLNSGERDEPAGSVKIDATPRLSELKDLLMPLLERSIAVPSAKIEELHLLQSHSREHKVLNTLIKLLDTYDYDDAHDLLNGWQPE